ncbi:MAG: hypothetical protein IJN71_06900 [Oscillospiraceae bacterium]|nr:hypothetical protein [Oscillospiraceae bacterium]
MTRRILGVVLALVMTLSLASCAPDTEDYISGTSFDPIEYDTGAVARYENQLYGIILEYPEKYQRIGNFDLDGYVTFEGDGVVVSVYVPDTENNDILTAEAYVDEVLELPKTEGSGVTKYGKCNGYKVLKREDGKITIDFIVKGVDAFYRFAYSQSEEDFTEENATFQQIMGSIRIDDGVYNMLNRMASRYKVLLEYATSMQYITDANYANHCLNNFASSGDVRHKEEALSTSAAIREEIEKIISHKREEDEQYEEMWNEVVESAEKILESCKKAEECVKTGDYEGAQKIARTDFSYDLSDDASRFLATINAEIAEY